MSPRFLAACAGACAAFALDDFGRGRWGFMLGNMLFAVLLWKCAGAWKNRGAE